MNPYKEFIIDEISGVEVRNQRYLDYQAGIQEVVEFIVESDKRQPDHIDPAKADEHPQDYSIAVRWDEWQAFKKSRGIK